MDRSPETPSRLRFLSLSLTRQGVPVIVTDRSDPIAVLHGLEQVEETAGTEERLASPDQLKRLGKGSDLIIGQRR